MSFQLKFNDGMNVFEPTHYKCAGTGEYRYSGTVALFLNINNLTNNQYERWIGLPVYGINVIGGLGVTF